MSTDDQQVRIPTKELVTIMMPTNGAIIYSARRHRSLNVLYLFTFTDWRTSWRKSSRGWSYKLCVVSVTIHQLDHKDRTRRLWNFTLRAIKHPLELDIFLLGGSLHAFFLIEWSASLAIMCNVKENWSRSFEPSDSLSQRTFPQLNENKRRMIEWRWWLHVIRW